MLTLTLLAVYLVSFILHYGMLFAYMQRKWPTIAERDYHEDMFFSLGLSVFGPLSLLIGALWITTQKGGKFYGLKFK